MDFLWTNKENNQDDVLAEDINYIASSIGTLNENVKTLEENLQNQVNTYGVALTNLENEKAGKDLSNVEDSVFLDKINAVLADGDEVSY